MELRKRLSLYLTLTVKASVPSDEHTERKLCVSIESPIACECNLSSLGSRAVTATADYILHLHLGRVQLQIYHIYSHNILY